MATEEKPRRSTGRAKSPEDGRLPNGEPDLRPSAGYAGNEPVQYSDETDEQFAGRVAMFESSRANAENIEAGGVNFDGQRAALKLRYEADLAAIDALEAKRTAKVKPIAPAKKPR